MLKVHCHMTVEPSHGSMGPMKISNEHTMETDEQAVTNYDNEAGKIAVTLMPPPKDPLTTPVTSKKKNVLIIQLNQILEMMKSMLLVMTPTLMKIGRLEAIIKKLM